MEGQWIKRRAHSRRLAAGRLALVRETWLVNPRESDSKRQTFRGPCPQCGAAIRSTNMPNGGWAHYEGADGLEKIKHPCFDNRRAPPKRGDDGNLDLFKDIPEPPIFAE